MCFSRVTVRAPGCPDQTLAFDRQDIEFVAAIREGREPESSAASVVPTMALLDKIDKSMNS